MGGQIHGMNLSIRTGLTKNRILGHTSAIRGWGVPIDTISTKCRSSQGVTVKNFKKCIFDNCPNVQYSGGHCPGHAAQFRAGKPLQPLGVAYYTEQTVCIIENCGNIAWSKGLCRGHYLQKRDGKPFGEVRQHEPIPCGVDGCRKTAVTRDYCQSHYNKMLATTSEKTCSYDGCDRKHESKGLCKTHAAQRRRGQNLTPIREWGKYSIGEVCRVEGCFGQSVSLGYCSKHFRWADQYGLNDMQIGALEKVKACQGCGAVARLTIDHDHSCCDRQGSCGRCVRGMLCSSCNSTLGHAKDDVDRLKGLIAYLTQ